MDAGALRHRLTIQAATLATNAIGERVPTWNDVGTVYASIRPASSREVAHYQAIRQEVTHALVMRYTPAVTADRRFRFGSRIFNIAGVVNVDERNIELRVLAAETTGAA